MNTRQKQALARQLREIRDEFQSILAASETEEAWKQLRRYDAAAIKAIAMLESALLTLST